MSSLANSLTISQGIAMTVGSVLGPAILILPALTAEIAGPASLISWVLMSIIGIFLAFSLGCLGSKYPDAGGIATYASLAFGQQIGRITGWLFLGIIPFAVPVVALSASNYLVNLMNIDSWAVIVFAESMIMVSIFLNWRGIETSGKYQLVITGMIVLMLLIVSFLGFSNIQSSHFRPFLLHGWHSVGSAAVVIFWSYVGFEMIVSLSEEFKNPAQDVRISLIIGSILVSVLYLIVSFVVVGTKAYGSNMGLAPLNIVVERAIGSYASVVTTLIATGCSFVTIHTIIAGFSRILYAQARDGDLPKWFLEIHPRYKVPTNAMFGQLLAYSAVLLFVFLTKTNIEYLIKWPSITFLALYSIAMAATSKLLPLGNWGRWTGYITLISCIILLLASGWACLYPISLIFICTLISKKFKRSHKRSL